MPTGKQQHSKQNPDVLPYETFEHEADIGIRGSGGTVDEAFGNAAKALYSVMVSIDAVEPREMRSLEVSAPDLELLLIAWLNALLALSDIERMVFSKFIVTIDGNSLSASVWGEALDRRRHMPRVEVKGATLHMLSVAGQQGAFIAQCVVDV